MPNPAPSSLGVLSDPAAIRAAMRLFDELGGIEAFIAAHPGLDLEPSQRCFIEENGRRYDAVPICCVAYGIQHPDRGPLRHADLGGLYTRLDRYLRTLGFRVVKVATPPGPRDFPWSREEVILLADLYVNVFQRRVPGPTNPDIVALSSYLRRAPWHDPKLRQAGFRSPSSLATKLDFLRAVDPARDPLPQRLRGGHQLEREVMLEFHDRPKDLAAAAAALRALIAFPTADLSPEVAAALEDTARSAGRAAPAGRVIDLPARNAIAAEANRRAVAWLESNGWSVEALPRSSPCDLLATRGAATLHVTVKGTTGAGSDVLLTPAEVRHARQRYPDTALVVAHSLVVVASPSGELSAVRGHAFVVRPWLPADESLTATGWCHAINPATANHI